MSVNIRYPSITGSTDKEQLAQIKSYLHQLVEQLNYALPTLGTGDGTSQAPSVYEVQGGEMSYYELRSLIMQELQEVDALFDQLSSRLESEIETALNEANAGIRVLGTYDTVGALKAEHPTGNAGDAYLVNGDLYVWSKTADGWQNAGSIQGPQGNPGADAVSPAVSIEKIDGGHRITITDASSVQVFDVMDGDSSHHFKLDDGTNLY
jgi:hypothetical protein